MEEVQEPEPTAKLHFAPGEDERIIAHVAKIGLFAPVEDHEVWQHRGRPLLSGRFGGRARREGFRCRREGQAPVDLQFQAEQRGAEDDRRGPFAAALCDPVEPSLA